MCLPKQQERTALPLWQIGRGVGVRSYRRVKPLARRASHLRDEPRANVVHSIQPHRELSARDTHVHPVQQPNPVQPWENLKQPELDAFLHVL
jgi:hypothetical protein